MSMNMDKKFLFVATAAAAVLAAVAGPNGDRPDDRHAWAVHDDNRPNPVEISAEEGEIPSDAIALFDGTQKSIDEHWCDAKGNPTKWILKDGLFYCVPKSGMAYTRDMVEDCQLHVEFLVPDPPGEGLGNSGVYVHGIYELQVLHSYRNLDQFHPDPPWKHANYADGQLGAVYGQNPPIVNPSRNAGKWQTYDILFHPAIWDGDRLVAPATITVFLNGILVQDEWKLEGPTRYVQRTKHDPKIETTRNRALALQDHGHPVPYRRIWMRKIPSRRANTVHGGDFFNPADAMRLRLELAAKTLEKAHASDKPANRLVWLWESYMYAHNDSVKAEIDALTPQYIARIAAWKGTVSPERSQELSNMSGFVDMGVRCGMFTKDDALFKAVKSALAATRAAVKHY